MKPLFKKPLSFYLLGILIMLVVFGIIMSTLTDEYIILIALLTIEFIVISVIMLHVYKTYLKPIKKAVKTIDKLVHGNYRVRIRDTSRGMVAELNENINHLARNLSELSIQEEMKTKQLLTVINNTESGLALIDEKGYIHIVNRKFLSLFNKEKNDYIGRLYYDVFDNIEIQETVQEAFLYEKNRKHSFTFQGELGERHIEVVGAPIFDERKILKGTVILLYDISELKNLSLMRKDFVANVSHELKTPITSIRGFAETLLDTDPKDEKVEKKFLNIISEESRRLQYLIEDLLALSTLEKDNHQLFLDKVDVSTLVEEVSPMLIHQAHSRDVSLEINIDKRYEIMADREEVKQVLINLLGNAINYTPEKGQVVLYVTDEKEYIAIHVQDTGIGVSQADIPRLFERFYRVDKARSRNTGGTGLGLSIVKHIVELHEGKLTVESEVDKGSTFSAWFPKNPILKKK